MMVGLYQLLATMVTFVPLCIFATNDRHALADGEIKVLCIKSEGEALLKFKHGLNDTSHRLSSWTRGSNCCKWKGIECNATIGHVISLHLGSANTQGYIQGEINSALLGLPYLSYLDLSWNDFNGSQVPGFLGTLRNLQYLNLSNSNFFGTITNQLENLSRLTLLDLSQNNDLTIINFEWLKSHSSLKKLDLSGIDLSNTSDGWIHALNMMPYLSELHLSGCQLEYAPPSLPQLNFDSLLVLDLSSNLLNSTKILDWLFQCCHNLHYLDLSDNEFTSPIPDSFDKLISLVVLKLSNNMFNGLIPLTLGKHPSSLKELHLSNNHINGTLTRSLPQLSKLVVLSIAHNDLEGVISDIDLENFKDLQVLHLSGNHLILNVTRNWVPPFQLQIMGLGQCQLGSQFPKWIHTQKNLSYIDISHNNISGNVPKWFWDISHKVDTINVSQNQLIGCVPGFSSHHQLEALDLSFNNFTCSLPYLPPNSKILNLAGNSFSGTISHICEVNTSRWEFLQLASNNLSGSLPNCWANNVYLFVINLVDNHFSGPIPNSFGNLKYLEVLSLNRNNFSGSLPSSLKNCSYLMLLDLGHNQLSGTIPSWNSQELQKLKVFILSSNLFIGIIPSALCQLKSLHILDLSFNHLSGPIPRCPFPEMAKESYLEQGIQGWFFIDFTGYVLKMLYFGNTGHFLLNWKGSNQVFFGQRAFALVKLLDLSSNLLTGDIPKEITSYLGLKLLNLSGNQLRGSIPLDIGDMKSLEALDLSRNKLSGIIPNSITNIDELSFLNVSQNNLTGQIPSGKHFDTFDLLSFMDNPNLCGPPLNKSCLKYGLLKKGVVKRKGLEVSSFYISMGIGFITGFWTICGPLLLSRSWRQSYFSFLGNIYDMLYVKIALTMAKQISKFQSSS